MGIQFKSQNYSTFFFLSSNFQEDKQHGVYIHRTINYFTSIISASISILPRFQYECMPSCVCVCLWDPLSLQISRGEKSENRTKREKCLGDIWNIFFPVFSFSIQLTCVFGWIRCKSHGIWHHSTYQAISFYCHENLIERTQNFLFTLDWHSMNLRMGKVIGTTNILCCFSTFKSPHEVPRNHYRNFANT